MSIKTYCDGCGKEMPDGECSRIIQEHGPIRVEVITAVNGVWNGGHVCHECVRYVVWKTCDTSEPNDGDEVAAVGISDG